MQIDHIRFYTTNATQTSNWFIDKIGFRSIGKSFNHHTHTEAIANNSIFLAISAPLNASSTVAGYLDSHPSGVGDVAFRVRDLDSILARANRLGVAILQPPQHSEQLKWSTIAGWDGLQHTLIEYSDRSTGCFIPNLRYYPVREELNSPTAIADIDHIVLNVALGELSPAVDWYRALFDFKIQQTFTIETERSGLYSQALIDPTGTIQFNINEPTSANSQIQEFIDLNGGAGIQHLALRSQNIVRTVSGLRSRGVSFLSVPQAYYTQLQQRLNPNIISFETLETLKTEQILVDANADIPESLLMQTFTQPIFEQPTFFLEIIERRQQAYGFGEGNFKALFAAVEQEQLSRNVGNVSG